MSLMETAIDTPAHACRRRFISLIKNSKNAIFIYIAFNTKFIIAGHGFMTLIGARQCHAEMMTPSRRADF